MKLELSRPELHAILVALNYIDKYWPGGIENALARRIEEALEGMR